MRRGEYIFRDSMGDVDGRKSERGDGCMKVEWKDEMGIWEEALLWP